MNLSDILKEEYKEKIKQALILFLQGKEKEFKHVSLQTSDIVQKLSQFCLNGKMVRGSLVCFIYNLFKHEITNEVIKASVAVELIHSAFLIHDDIMDQDTVRRGNKTIYAQYKESGVKQQFSNPLHFGESAGICVGDIAYFLGFSLLAELNNSEIISFCSNEFSKVAIAQMQDVYNGFSHQAISEEQILSIYLHKTGRYTFSVPFVIGAILAKENNQTRELLEKLGEYLGIIFQLKDDEIGLLGKEENIGKPVGSDIKENKKTVMRKYIFDNASVLEKEKLDKIFGNNKITNKDIAYVLKIFDKYKIASAVSHVQEKFYRKAEEIIEKLSSTQQGEFFTLLAYNMHRKK